MSTQGIDIISNLNKYTSIHNAYFVVFIKKIASMFYLSLDCFL